MEGSALRKNVYAVDQTKSVGPHRQAPGVADKDTSAVKNKKLIGDTVTVLPSRSGRVQKYVSGAAERDASVKKKGPPPASTAAADPAPGRSATKRNNASKKGRIPCAMNTTAMISYACDLERTVLLQENDAMGNAYGYFHVSFVVCWCLLFLFYTKCYHCMSK